jgi:hypothetical protein
VKHLNVKTTFLNGGIQEQVCIIQLQEFVELGHEDEIRLLLKAIYGLKQAI